MTTISNNDIAHAIYLTNKEHIILDQSIMFGKIIDFLFKKRFLSRAGEILKCLEKIINKEENIIVVKVSSVIKLQDQIKNDLEEFLKKRYSAKKILFTEILNTKLLGGIKIEVDDEVIDLTLHNRINKLQEHLNKD